MGAQSNFWSWAVWVPILITLSSGTISALANKVVYETPVEGRCGKTKFQKAYFFTLAMFLGEAGCLAMYYAKQWMAKRRAAQPNNHYQSLGAGLLFEDGPLNQMTPHLPAVSSLSVVPPMEEAAPKKPPIWVYLVLCLFDLSATAVGGVGFMWVDASTNQMLRGSMTIFCAIFSVLLLRRRLNWKQWSSLGMVVFGLALVGMAGMLKKKHDEESGAAEDDDVTSAQLMLGILLVLFGSALNAIQNVYEEKLLKDLGGAEVDPLELVGWEGVFGSLLSAFVMLPIVYYIPGDSDECGRVEDSIHTLQQLGHSPMVVMLVLAYSISLMFMNWSSQQISQQLSSVHRNLVSSVRIVLVWVFSLWMFYATRGNEQVYGEEWSNWSLIKLGGFLVLMIGTVLYSWAGLLAEKEQEQAQAQADALTKDKMPEYVLPVEAQTQHIGY